MFFQIVSFLLDIAAGLLAGACLLRAYMQYQRIPFGNPVGRFVFAITDWLVLPLRRVLPAMKRVDTASVVAAYLVQLLKFVLLWLLVGAAGPVVLVLLLAVFGLLRLVISGLIGLLIVYAVLSWVRADTAVYDVIDRICAPMLRPVRRVVPLVGGIDLSPLVLLVLLQVAGMLLDGLQRAIVS